MSQKLLERAALGWRRVFFIQSDMGHDRPTQVIADGQGNKSSIHQRSMIFSTEKTALTFPIYASESQR